MSNIRQFVKGISKFGTRQGKTETAALKFIENILKEKSIRFQKETFNTFLPNYGSCRLQADARAIAAQPCCFVGGRILNDSLLLSSLVSSQKNIFDTNINSNKKCPVISKSNHYFAPAFAVSHPSMKLLKRAKNISGNVVVKKTQHTSANLLVGNNKNPANIVFTHYDSIGPGACDNAAGVAAVLAAVMEHPTSLQTTLYVIAGNEELSYDKPVYWGRGYRVFERSHKKLLSSCKKIIVVDSVGLGMSRVTSDPRLLHLGFPLKSIERWNSKAFMVTGNFNALMKVYHSDLDKPENLNYKEITRAKILLKNLVDT